jgi:HlyD family secretion protein
MDDSLEVYLARHSGRGGAVYVTLILFLTAILVTLPLVHVSVTVAAPGIVRPLTEKHEVRATTSGMAERLLVERSQSVSRGDPIVVLRGTDLEARKEVFDGRMTDISTRIDDLEKAVAFPPLESGIPALRSPSVREQFQQLRRELQEAQIRRESARTTLDRTNGLFNRGLATAQDFESARTERAKTEAEIESLIGNRIAAWTADLTSLRTDRDDLVGSLRRIEEERRLLTIESPVAGTVEELASISSGSFVQAGEVVAVISPDTDMVAEIYLGSGDIGLLRTGRPVRLLFDSFDYRSWGFLQATIVEISRDYLMIDQKPVFRVLAHLPASYLQLDNGVQGRIQKGMSLQARFVVADRTLFQLLRDDISDWLDPREFRRPSAEDGSR